MDLNGLPLEHGMEIEQDGDVVPSEILRDSRGEYFGRWESDLSGPREFPDLGPRKQVKSLVTRFQDTARQYDDEEPWSWHNETGAGDGCGSHAHITFADQTEGDRERFVEGMTIAWNSAVELTPFLAPFFCSDWENGFRGSINRWASPQLTRYSQSTMDRKVRRNNDRTYDSVTLSPREGSKPITIELRLNEAHPSFALVGLTFLRRTMTKAMRGGWSPKLAGDRRGQLNELYRAVYRGGDVIESMQEAGPFEFKEGRGIPGSDQLEFDSAWDVLMKVMAVNGIDRGAYDDHVKKLIQKAGSGDEVRVHQSEAPAGAVTGNAMAADGGELVYTGSAIGPQNNGRALWHTCDDDFSWDVGPDVDPR